ncbi:MULTISPECIES: MobC family plasmid mobilization relaxosome protein [Bifidobacterium]|uniref:Mobilization protein MobC n=2 Tax=Bifidobacterium TaxID=1678 RepID=A0A261FTF2_9BIFI|nr:MULTISPECIES: MobC family plasmid mobilization relaxosome protein [Bifidobacterium]OZG62474.1 mobilization protein MobC [Bifidobacterium lemurum]OZG69010.1 mobilization protein MobC [Bifidobacterium eulemuris]QOL31461.1 MobC family plasmid mobilization relaxosome protein [Bifidobacterium eulemuris]QOL33816.1 MobC family plasmid mobilization relaxosome protein [Bifidobacterium lemurum]
MASWKGNRSRPHRRSVTFTDEELRWLEDSRKIENQQRAATGLPTVGWMQFARQRLITSRRLWIAAPPGAKDLSSQISRIGNNINQIAHKVNLKNQADSADLRELQAELEEIKGCLKRMERDMRIGNEELSWRT